MAERTAKAAGGVWKNAGTWEPEATPAAGDDLKANAASGNLEVSATAGKCRSFDTTGYTHTWTLKKPVNIGTTSSNEVVEANVGVALKLSSTTKVVSEAEGELSFIATSKKTEQITSGGNTLPTITVSGTETTFKVMDELKGSLIKLEKGILDTNSQTVVLSTAMEVPSASSPKLKCGTSTFKLTGTGLLWNTPIGSLLEASSSTVIISDNSEKLKTFTGGAGTYGTLKLDGCGVKVEAAGAGSTITISEINLNGRKAIALKAKYSSGSTTIEITEGSIENIGATAGAEITGPGIPNGTIVESLIEGKKYKISKSTTEAAEVATEIKLVRGAIFIGGQTFIVTTLTCGGTSGEKVRIASSKNEEAAKVKLPVGTTVIENARIKDIKVEGGEIQALNSVDLGGNTGVKFQTTILRSISITQEQTPALPKQISLSKEATQNQSLAIIKKITPSLPIELSQGQTVGSLKQSQQSIPVFEEVVPLRGTILVAKSQKVFQEESLAIVKNLGALKSNLQEILVKTQKSGATHLAVTEEAIPSIAKKDLSLHVSDVQEVTPGVLKAIALGARKVIQESISFVEQPKQVQLIALELTQSTVVEVKKFTQKVLQSIVPVVPKVQMFLPKSLTSTQEVQVQPVKRVKPKVLPFTQGQNVSVSPRILGLFRVAVGVTQSVSVGINKRLERALNVVQEVQTVSKRGFDDFYHIDVETIVNLTKTFIRHTIFRQEVLLTESSPEVTRHPSSGVIIWERDEQGRLLKVISELGQYEGELEPGEPDTVFFTLNKKPEEIEGQEGTTRDPQWQ